MNIKQLPDYQEKLEIARGMRIHGIDLVALDKEDLLYVIALLDALQSESVKRLRKAQLDMTSVIRDMFGLKDTGTEIVNTPG